MGQGRPAISFEGLMRLLRSISIEFFSYAFQTMTLMEKLENYNIAL